MAQVIGSSDPKSGTCMQRTTVTSFLRRELQVWPLDTSLVHLSSTQWGTEHTGGGWTLGGTAGAGRVETDLESWGRITIVSKENTEHPAKYESQVNNKQPFSMHMSLIGDILIQEKFICCLSEIHIFLGTSTWQPYLEEQRPGLFWSVVKFQRPYGIMPLHPPGANVCPMAQLWMNNLTHSIDKSTL